MSAKKSKEVVHVGKRPEEDWGDIISAVLPQSLGIHPTIFMDRAQQQAEQLAQPPTTSVARALFNLASEGKLHLQPNLIVRMPGSELSGS